MGSGLVKAAYTSFWFEDERAAVAYRLGQPTVRNSGNPLPPYRAANLNERAVLHYMCSIAHDTDDPPRYWGGRDALARYALGRVVPTGDDQVADKERRSIYESVRQAIDGLVAWGAIERVGSAFPGRQQEYAIRVMELQDALIARQPEVGPFAACGWVMRSQRLSKTQPEVGPETKNTKTKSYTENYDPAFTYLESVESGASR